MQQALFARSRKTPFLRVVLFGTPLCTCLVELGHPILDRDNTIHMLAPIVTQWIFIHLALAPLFALTGWALWLLLEEVSGILAWISRSATSVFAVGAIGYECVVGLGSGIMSLYALDMSASQRRIVQAALSHMLYSPILGTIAICIIIAGAVAIVTAVLALAKAGAPRIPLIFLLGALLFARAHESPYGPLGNMCFLVAALWLELEWHRGPEVQGHSQSPESGSSDATPLAAGATLQ